MVIDDVAVDTKKKWMKVRSVAAEERQPVYLPLLELSKQIATDIGNHFSERIPPARPLGPIALNLFPEAHGGCGKTGVGLNVAQVLSALNSDQLMRRKVPAN